MSELVTARRRFRFFERHGRAAQVAAQFQFEPRYWLLGVSWDFRRHGTITGSDRWHGEYRAPWTLHLYIALIPTLPLHVYVYRTVRS
jgi:hypothetical protein